MNIYLISTAGYPNYGDEFLLGSWLHFIEKSFPNANVWVDCHSPGNAAAIFSNRFPSVRFTDFVWRVAMECPEDSSFGSINYGIGSWSVYRDKWSRFQHASDILLNSDIIHIIGAGFINQIWPKNLAIPGVVRAAPYKKSSKRIIMTGAGLLPLESSSSPLLSLVLQGFDHIDLRDYQSAELLKSTGVIDLNKLTVTGDDSFMIKMPKNEDWANSLGNDFKRVVLCLQGDFWDEIDTHFVFTSLIEEIKKAFSPDIPIEYYEFIPGVDARFYENFKKSFSSVRFIGFSEIMSKGLNIQGDSFVITSRYHMHLISARHSARGLWINCKPGYYDIKHRSLVESGSRWKEFIPGEGIRLDLLEPVDHQRFDQIHEQKISLCQKLYGVEK